MVLKYMKKNRLYLPKFKQNIWANA